MRVHFVAGFGPIVRDMKKSAEFYVGSLQLPLRGDFDYLHTERVPGVNGFGRWPPAAAAESCFGKKTWPKRLPAPTAWLEFDVENVVEATEELRDIRSWSRPARSRGGRS